MPQLYWRHTKIHGVKGIGVNKFRREYPLTVEDGFAIFDGSWFDQEYLHQVFASLKKVDGELRIYEKPEKGQTYAVGVDPSWCNGFGSNRNDSESDRGGSDWAVAQVLSHDGRQVATLSTREGGEIRFATKVAELCLYYNKARALVESNTGGAGPVVIRELKKFDIPMWYEPARSGFRTPKNPKHWTTAHGNKAEGFAHLRQIINSDALTLNDMPTVQELMHVREVDGDIAGRDGYHDDHAFALMLAEWNRRSLPASRVDTSPFQRRYVAHENPWTATRRVG
jgi:hypothetical protein